MNVSRHALQLAQSIVLLGENDRAERFVNGFRQGNPTPLTEQLLPLAVMVLAVVTVYYIAQLVSLVKRRRRLHSDRRLFQELCRLHRLDGTSVRTLEQLIHTAKLEQAPSIFLRPDLFTANGQVLSSDRHTELLVRLKDRLFPA